MDMDTVLHNLGVREDTLSGEEESFLDEQGYLPLPGLMSPEQVNIFRRRLEDLIRTEGEAAGAEVHQEAGTYRLSDLINKDAIFDFCYTHPKLLAAIRRILTSDFKVHSLNCRFALPGQGLQALHMDWRPRDDADRERVRSGEYFVANSLWLMNDLTEENGATRLVPGSHKTGLSPKETMDDPTSTHPDEIRVIASAGTVVVFNAHTWHGGSQNRTDDLRRVMHMAFVRRELPQQTDQKQYLLPETEARLTDEIRMLLDV